MTTRTDESGSGDSSFMVPAPRHGCSSSIYDNRGDLQQSGSRTQIGGEATLPHTALFSVALVTSLLLFVGCQGMSQTAPRGTQADQEQEAEEAEVLMGETGELGGAELQTWVEINEDGTPMEIGYTFPASALDDLPEDLVQLSLDFPSVEDLPFEHGLFDWAPRGHDPHTIYGVPHFDAHFYTVSRTVRENIDGGIVTNHPDPEYLPDGYITGPPDAAVYSMPQMGVHWVNREARELHGAPFDQTLIYGSHEDDVIFIEPMFTRAFLEGRPEFSADIPLPQAVEESGYYPTRYSIRYDSESDAYHVSLEEFQWWQAANFEE